MRRTARALLAFAAAAPALWALGCGKPAREDLAAVQEAADSADQLMLGLRQYMTNNGVRQAYLTADTGYVYENSGHVDLKHIHVTFFTPAGDSSSVLTALQGFYNMRSGLMEARGNVVVVRNDGARLTTSDLVYDQGRNEVRTDSAYTFDSADRHAQGQGFTSDPSFTNIRSAGVHGTAGHFTLPGQ